MKVLSGIQPSGELHIGNYLGALKQFVELQNSPNTECFFMVADLHALTVPRKASELRKQVAHVKRAYLAIGLDPKRCTLFVQSRVPQHAELSWIFETLSPLGELQRMTQFKEKKALLSSRGAGEVVNAGLLTYPVLQAADILLYKPTHVPVGKDQLQHLELTRTLARRFNKMYGKVFPEPKAIVRDEGANILSLQDPAKKMSKSLGPAHYIGMFESEKDIREKIKRAVTDSGREVKYDPKRKPAISNLLTIYSLITERKIKEMESKYHNLGYAEFKNDLAKSVVEHLRPYRKRYTSLKDAAIKNAYAAGAKRAEKEAETTMQAVRARVGLR